MNKSILALALALVTGIVWSQNDDYAMYLYEESKVSKELHPYNVHSGSRVSHDGQTLFFFVDDMGEDSEHPYGQEIVVTTKNENGQWVEAEHLDELNNGADNGVHFISQDGNRILLLSRYRKNGLSVNGVSMSHKKHNGAWSNPHHLKIKKYQNSGACSFYMNKEENVLLLAITPKETYGEQDIFVSFKKDARRWTKPLNLGSVVNTAGSDGAMMLSEDGKTLYYSTDGKADGMGGYDIYKTTRLDDTWTNWTEPENIGAPFNTPDDELYYSFSPMNEEIFISRHYKESSDYLQSEIISYKKREFTKSPVDYFTKKSNKKDVQEEMASTLKTEGKIVINDIYFEFDGHDLDEASTVSLENIVDVLNSNEDFIIEVGAHTDSRGSDSYNLNLSEKRAQSVTEYLISNGVDQARLRAMGFGETELTNKCGNNNDCSEGDHAINRRVEFKLLKSVE